MGVDRDLILRLSRIFGPSGCEDAVAEAIRAEIAPYADRIETDSLGNLFAHRRGKKGGAHLLLCAHMDETALMLRQFDDDGMLRMAPVGEFDPRYIVSKRISVGEKGVPGVIGAKAIHLQSESDFHAALKFDELRADIGASSADEAKKLVSLGDYISFDADAAAFGDDMLTGRALSGRAGCAALIEAFRGEYERDITAAFLVQHEVETRGALVAAERVRPDECMVIGAVCADDIGGGEEYEPKCRLGGGAAIPFIDRALIARPNLFGALCGCAEALGIAHQPVSAQGESGYGGAIETRAGAIPVCMAAIPCRNLRTPGEIISGRDVDSAAALIQAFAARIN